LSARVERALGRLSIEERTGIERAICAELAAIDV